MHVHYLMMKQKNITAASIIIIIIKSKFEVVFATTAQKLILI
jgi:hypothetical protein